MLIVAVGNEIDGWTLPEGAEWCVYHYSAGDYEGSGEAYCGNGDGKYWRRSLGHCSCYGPLDEPWDDCMGISDLRMQLIGDTTGIAAKITEMKLANL